MEVKKALERMLCAQIGVLGMSDSLTNTTACAIMRQCQQKTVGDGEREREEKKGPAKTVSGHA